MENAKIYLCKADSSILGTLTGIQAQTCNLKRNATNLWELTFDVNRYIDTNGELVQSDYYDSLDNMMRLYLDGVDMQVFFVIDSEPVIKGDGYQETKSVTAHSIECELCNIYLKNFKINCGMPGSQEYLVCNTDADGNKDYYNVNPYTGLPDNYISLVNYDEPQLSLLHLALQGTGWHVKEGLDANVYLDKDHYFRTVIHTVKNPAGTSSQRVTGSVKKRCDEGKNVYAVELQKWASSGIEFTTENLSDITIVAQSSNSTIRINSEGIATNVDLPSRIALMDSDDTFYPNKEGLKNVTWNSEDEKGIVLTYKNLRPGTYKIVSPYDFAENDTEGPTVYDRGVQIKSITVSEHSSTSDRTVHKFQSSDLSADADQEEIMGICQIKKSFETSDSIYSFFMKTISPAASVIFEFDRKHKTVGIVKADNYGEDTGVFITMRNLMNSFEVTSTSNDSIVTKLIPTGANNLGIEQVNFGKDYILNLDYFMNTRNEYGDYKFVSKELHDKYNCWKDFRDKNRETYIELTKLYNQTISDISELKNRVPNDGCMIDYKTYKLEKLKIAHTAYKNALSALTTIYKNEYSVVQIGEAPTYTPIPEDAVNIMDTPYWHDFYAYKEAIIPQVEEALKMYCQTGENGELVFDTDGNPIELEFGNPDYYANENIVKEVDSYLYEWSIYGLDELEAKKKAWLEAANLLFDKCFIVSGTASSPTKYRTANKNGWDSLNDDTKSRFTTFNAYINQLNQYLDYMSFEERDNSFTKTTCKGIIRQCEDEITKRTTEISKVEQEQNIYYERRKNLADSVALDEHFKLTEDAENLFTLKDINIINGLMREQEFSNENILTTSLDNIVTAVNSQEELYQSAAEKLYEISQPQYSFRTELDNLYALDAFKVYQKPFDIGNFIRVGLEIHEEICDNNFIKLRLISISHNPLYANENLSVEFSTMTRAFNGISDLAFLLSSETSGNGTSSSSSSGSGTYGNNDANMQISNNMLNALLSTELFGTAVSDVLLDTIKANRGDFNTLFSHSGAFDLLETGELKVNGDCLFNIIKSNNWNGNNNLLSNTKGSIIDLSKGLFSFAGGKLKWDEDTLTIEGTLNGCDGNFTGSINVNNNFKVNNKGDVTANGKLIATDAEITGAIEATNSVISESIFIDGDIEAETLKVKKTGSIAGWNFDSEGFYIDDAKIGISGKKHIGKDGLLMGDLFSVNKNGITLRSAKYNDSVKNNKELVCNTSSDIDRIIIYGYQDFTNDTDFYLSIHENRNYIISLTSEAYKVHASFLVTSKYRFCNSDIQPITSLDFPNDCISDNLDEHIPLSEIGYITFNNLHYAGNNEDRIIRSNYDEEDLINYRENEIPERIRIKTRISFDSNENNSLSIIGVCFNDNTHEEISISSSIDGLIIDSISKKIKINNTYMTDKGFSSKYTYDNIAVSGKPLYIGSDGTIGLSHSSERFKNSISTNLTELSDPHGLYDIDIVQYKYNDNYFSSSYDKGIGKYFIGFIAEDIAKKFKDGATFDEDNLPDGWDIRYMFPAALKLIQEQHNEIETLKEQLEKLQQLVKAVQTNRDK